MAAKNYLSIKSSVSGFSFANLGLFKGFSDGIINAVWSLVLLEIFLGNSALVGVYSSIYYGFYMFVTLISGEILKLSTKTKLLFFSMAALGLMYFMMAFSVKPSTFVILDFASSVPQMLISSLLSLFMADFVTKDVGMERLNGRYVFWVNMGAFVAPMVAMWMAEMFGVRTPFFAVALINLLGLIYFRWFGIVEMDKKVPKISAKRTFRSVWNTTIAYFQRSDLRNAYIINFGQYAISSLRLLYVPIMVVQAGFSKDILGIILAVGILPYVLLANPLGKIAQKTGIKIWVALGFLSFAFFAFWASFATGWVLLAIFIAWQFSGALIEPLTDIYFFNAARKSADRDRFFGIFKTVNRLPRFIVPMLGAGVIAFCGATGYVWILAGIIAALIGLFTLSVKQ
ncbi:MAG: MFS transporter [Rickettsiales bacterium]|nr:MFS transporter [Rickettsiales bacterium]